MTFWKRLKEQLGNTRDHNAPKAEAKKLPDLTTREMDVFRLLLEGYTLQETADQLGVKYATVNTHTTAIYKKLGVKSRAELIIRYRNFEKENDP